MIASPVSGLRLNTVKAQGGLPPRDDLVPTGHTPVEKYSAVDASDIVDKTEVSRYIVLFEGASLVRAKSGTDINGVEGRNYLDSLAVNRQTMLTKAESLLGRSIEVRYIYDVILNGVSVELSAQEAEALQSLPGIRKVLKDQTYTYTTDAGPEWIGAGSIWQGDSVPSGIGTEGEGVLVGILDGGINFDHPSFSDDPDDGYVYSWTGDYLGVCSISGDPDYADACNNKVVGAWSYTYDAPSDFVTPEDSEGHGSHTASTVAGNFVDVDFYGTAVTISGVAPHAQIVAYDVCYPTPSGGQCAGEDSVAAVQQAILDGVDVINYSISGGENPYGDAVELAFLDATAAGVTVATSAGNSGPDAETVAHRSPWLLSTAATSHDRKFTSDVDFSNALYQNITTLAGQHPFTVDILNHKVKFAGEDGNPLGCITPGYSPNFYDGAIALIKRGTCTFSEKINTAEAAGAIGVLIFTDDRAPGAMSVSGTNIPGVMLDIPGTTGDAIAAWVAGAADDTVSISAYGALRSYDYADIMADFSSRGPNTTFDVLKPDIAAPGLEILAAVADGEIPPDGLVELDLYQGTSMASPHDAGSAALLKALHPTWTPSEIKSALMLTAYDMLLKEDKTTAADPFDIGAGRIQLELAGLTGLVMNETIAKYEAADPALGGDVKTLNIASLYNSSCVGECSWTRTFKSVADLPATYTVSAPDWVTVTPASFTINPGATQQITITADVSAYEPGEWVFANLEFLTESTFSAGDPVVVLSQDFTDATFPPTGWAVYDVDTGDPTPSNWERATDYFSSAPASAKHKFNCTQEQEGWLVTPQITIPVNGITSLSFKQRGNWVGDLVYHGIMVSTGSGEPATGDYIELVQPPAPPEDAWSTTPVTVDLSAYAGQAIYVAFKYVGDCADDWWVDDVQVSNLQAGAPISDVAIPLAALPAASNLPGLAKFETHRDAGGDTLEDLVAVEITGLTVDKYGWVKGQLNEIQLAQDPTNSAPYDNLSQVWYTIVPMDQGAARLVAEITASTAPDVDLFWGFDVNGDGMPQSGEEYDNSATGTAFEYLTEWGFPVGFYDVWIMVQNWQGSGAALDDITLSVGLVPYEPADPENMTVVGPDTNPAGVPFNLDVYWHDIDTEEGDRLYGLIDVYADATYDTWVGAAQLDVVRKADDVVKTADVASAEPGDTITYTIEITNYTTEPIAYTINDVLPEGVTYVPGSVTGGAVYDEATNAITWSGQVASSYRDYVKATSAEDPNCSLAIMADGDPTDAYLDWKTTSYGFSASSSISGDSFWYYTFGSYPAFNFYGVDYSGGMDFTADGLLGWPAAVSANNTAIPDPADPNNILALFWDDLVVQYNLTNNYGVTMVGDGSTFATIEYDDVQLKADTTKTLDMEVGYFLQPDDAPGAYEIVYAFDNITPGLFAAASGTIGVENADGTVGTLVSYNDPALTITDGSAICFDWALLPAPPVVITFQVTVDEDIQGSLLTNVALHSNDQMGTVEESAVAVVDIITTKTIFLPLLFK